ncbi:MAG: M28 family peptidase [Pirellulaceae bacterium]
MKPPTTEVAPSSELDLTRRLIRKLERECPRRKSASPDERRAQELLAEEFSRRGLTIRWQTFRASRNLYAVLGLHQAVAVLGSIVLFWQPAVGAALLLFTGVSYLLDCHYVAFLLRGLLGYAPSQNLLAEMPAVGQPRRRIVFWAHADAAPTGWMFHPLFLKLVLFFLPQRPAFLRKQILNWVVGSLVLIVLATIRTTSDWWWFPGIYFGLTLGSLTSLILMLQIVVNDRIVPGANDNLSGCAALVLLADRLAGDRPSDVEYVFVVTGCEESGRGGALALAREMRSEWPPESTTCIVLDSISGGTLRYHHEGELWPLSPPPALVEQLQLAAAGDERFEPLRPFHAPAGATDAAPLHLYGYRAVCLSRIDPVSDIPRNYHVPADRSGNLDHAEIVATIDFTERLVRNLVSKRV